MRNEVENPMITYREFEPKVVAYCSHCNNSLHSDEEFLKFDHEYFCEDICFIEYMGVEKVEGCDI